METDQYPDPHHDSRKPVGKSIIPGLCGSPVIVASQDMALVSRSAAAQLRHASFPRQAPPGDPHQAGFFVVGLYCPRAGSALLYIMAKKSTRAGWPLRHDRELIMLAKTHSAQAIADKFDRPITTILKRAERLGLSIRGKAKK
jgi:hypothetical protein